MIKSQSNQKSSQKEVEVKLDQKSYYIINLMIPSKKQTI